MSAPKLNPHLERVFALQKKREQDRIRRQQELDELEDKKGLEQQRNAQQANNQQKTSIANQVGSHITNEAAQQAIGSAAQGIAGDVSTSLSKINDANNKSLRSQTPAIHAKKDYEFNANLQDLIAGGSVSSSASSNAGSSISVGLGGVGLEQNESKSNSPQPSMAASSRKVQHEDDDDDIPDFKTRFEKSNEGALKVQYREVVRDGQVIVQQIVTSPSGSVQAVASLHDMSDASRSHPKKVASTKPEKPEENEGVKEMLGHFLQHSLQGGFWVALEQMRTLDMQGEMLNRLA